MLKLVLFASLMMRGLLATPAPSMPAALPAATTAEAEAEAEAETTPPPSMPAVLPEATTTEAEAEAEAETTPAPVAAAQNAATPAPVTLVTALNICEEVYGGQMDTDGRVCCASTCDGKCGITAEVCQDDVPTTSPTKSPTPSPTPLPTNLPSVPPTPAPTPSPTDPPTPTPTEPPTPKPTSQPTTATPTTADPTVMPSLPPTPAPTPSPTEPPTMPPTTMDPTPMPTLEPTDMPSVSPTPKPTAATCTNAGGLLHNSVPEACCHADCGTCGGQGCSTRGDGVLTFGTGTPFTVTQSTADYCCTSNDRPRAWDVCAADPSGVNTVAAPCCLEDSGVCTLAGGRRLQSATPAPSFQYPKDQCCSTTIHRKGRIAPDTLQCSDIVSAPCKLNHEAVELEIVFDKALTNSQPTVTALAGLLSVPEAQVTILSEGRRRLQQDYTVRYSVGLPKYAPLIKATVGIVTQNTNGIFTDNLALALIGQTIAAGGSAAVSSASVPVAPALASFTPTKAPSMPPTTPFPSVSPTPKPTFIFEGDLSDEQKMAAGAIAVIIILGCCFFVGVCWCCIYNYRNDKAASGGDEESAPVASSEEAPTTEMTAGSGDDDLPEGWETKEADDGRVYFHYVPTGATQWTKPKEGDTPM